MIMNTLILSLILFQQWAIDQPTVGFVITDQAEAVEDVVTTAPETPVLVIVEAPVEEPVEEPPIPALPEQTGAVEATETPAPVEASPAPAPVETPAPPVPVITFSTASLDVVKTTSQIKTRWIVSELDCPHCPAAKARFLAAGGSPDHIITIAEARRRHGKVVRSIPYEYTTDETVTHSQPENYRFASSMTWELDGDRKPSKATLLNHLRRGGHHQGKPWQAWHLEEWNIEHLYALHDDDHTGAVPTFAELADVEAVVSGAESTPDTIAAALAAHLLRYSGKVEGGDQSFGGLFDIEVEDHGDYRKWIADLIGKNELEFPSAGVKLEWGGDRTLSFRKDSITITPGVKVSVTKFRISASTTLTGVSYAPDLSWVKLSLMGVPDLTIKFVP